MGEDINLRQQKHAWLISLTGYTGLVMIWGNEIDTIWSQFQFQYSEMLGWTHVAANSGYIGAKSC